MATIARAAVTLTPALVLPARLTRSGRSVVHAILGDQPDVTSREPGPRAGDLHLIFPTAADAITAVDALSMVGGPWTIDDTDDCDGAWRVVGDVAYEPTGDGLRSRLVILTVQEVAS